MSGYKIKINFNLLLKIGIGFICIGYLYYEFFVRQKFELLWQQFQLIDFNTHKLIILCVALTLVFLNWGLESLKWRFLISKLQVMSFGNAFQSVVSGITISIFTPNRVGEFAARIFYLPNQHRIKGILLSIIGSISQLCITLVIGSFGLSWYFLKYQHSEKLELLIIIILAFAFGFGCLFLYYNIDLLSQFLLKINKGRKTRFYLKIFRSFSSFELTRVILFSLLRFLVFNIQYYLLLLFFDINIGFIDSMMITSAIFFVLAIVPSVALTEIGVRGAAAIYFLGFHSANSFGIVAASYLLWCINLALPALLGLLFLLPLKFFSK